MVGFRGSEFDVHAAQNVNDRGEAGEIYLQIGVDGDAEIHLQRFIQHFHAADGIGSVQPVGQIAVGKLHIVIPQEGSHGDFVGVLVEADQNHGVGAGASLPLAAVLTNKQNVDDVFLPADDFAVRGRWRWDPIRRSPAFGHTPPGRDASDWDPHG